MWALPHVAWLQLLGLFLLVCFGSCMDIGELAASASGSTSSSNTWHGRSRSLQMLCSYPNACMAPQHACIPAF